MLALFNLGVIEWAAIGTVVLVLLFTTGRRAGPWLVWQFLRLLPAVAMFVLVFGLLGLFAPFDPQRAWLYLGVYAVIALAAAVVTWPLLALLRLRAFGRTPAPPRAAPRQAPPPRRGYGPVMRALTGLDAPPERGLFAAPPPAARRDVRQGPGAR